MYNMHYHFKNIEDESTKKQIREYAERKLEDISHFFGALAPDGVDVYADVIFSPKQNLYEIHLKVEIKDGKNQHFHVSVEKHANVMVALDEAKDILKTQLAKAKEARTQ